MDAKKPDRRTIKTRRALCAGLAELLSTKELHRITVQEIADKADVNRVIFTMVFSPYSTGTLRDKIDKMIGGTYLTIFRERFAEAASGRSAGAAGRENFEFACQYHAMGCLAVIEKWVRGAYAQPKDLITKTISELDAIFEAYLAAHFR